FGDDPREPDSRKVFSVALLEGPSKPVGYLYVVLNSQLTDSVAEDLRGSYILRLGLRNALAYGTAALLIGLIASLVFTRPLRRLARRMEDFQVDEIPAEPPNLLLPAAPASLPQAAAAGAAAHDASSSAIPAPHPAASGDEVRLLETRFEEMAERLRRRVDHSEQIADFRRELMANISHDLRTPIATLRGYLETLCLRGGVLSEKQREEYLGIALKHSERLGRLVDELIELYKLEGREMQPSLDRFRLGELIQDNVQRFRLRAEEKGITLQADFNPDLPPVYADVGLMERALENLIENALRHTEAGGTVTVRLRKEPAELVLSVSDTGCGIAEEDLPYIFDRFYRSKLTAAGEGVGLGLAITQRIAQLHGGSLEVESQLGKGSVFSFSLEIAPLTYQLMAEDLNGLTSVTGPMTRRSLQ
ncbi:MAG: HAMP domain-containing sensor histidine kinase, partial [Acidobacteriota bacterium]